MSLRPLDRTLLSSLILLSAALVGGVATAQSGGKPKPPSISKAVVKQAQAAQTAIKAEKWADCLAALSGTDAVPDKTPYDEYAVSELRTVCAARSGDFAAAEPALAKGLEVGEANGFIDEEARKLRLRQLTQVNYQLKNYSRAAEFGRRASQVDPGNRDVRLLTAQALYLIPDNAAVAAFVEPWVAELEQRNETPPELPLNLWASACVRMKDDKCTRRAVEKQVAYAPSDEAWGNLFLLTMRDSPPDQNLNVLRFAHEVGALKTGDDVAEYASLAMEKGYPGEAQAVVEAAIAAGKFGDPGKMTPGAANLLQQSKAVAAPDRASLARQSKEAAAQKTGVAEVRVGQAYLSYGQPAEAVASIERGLAKGGVKAVDEANLSLGIARLKAGDKAGAVAAFDAVKDPFLARLAGYWKLRAR
jgi:Tfp pilus assembly protein PilF